MSDLVGMDDYTTMQDSLRPWVAARYKKMFEALEPYLDGSYGDVDPRHASVAVQVLRALGQLYRVTDRPTTQQAGIGEEEVRARIQAAVLEARIGWESQRRELESAARAAVAEQLRREQF